MANDERLTEIFCDKNKQNFILEMVKDDCRYLFKCYPLEHLMPIIEYYEEFMIEEINKLFEQCNSFNEVAATHQIDFAGFLRIIETNVDMCEMTSPPKRVKLTEDLYVIYITMQEWLLRGAKGQQFYSMLNIDAFNFDRQFNPAITKIAAQTVFCQLIDASNTISILMYHFQFTETSSKWCLG